MPDPVVGISTKPPIHYYPGKRFAIVLASWCLAGVGVLSSVMFVGARLAGEKAVPSDVLFLFPIVAWVALAVMSVCWVRDRRCHWRYPVVGTVSGVISAVMFVSVFFFYVSAMPIAIYLVFWHLKRSVDAG